jgi:WD40 repeat protein
MQRIILTIFTFIFCLSWAEVKVEKVLETTSIKEYNQWVKQNKAKYPGLRRYYLKVECIKWGKEWKVSYYSEDGDLTKEELLIAKPGWWLYASGESDLGKVVIIESDSSLGESSPSIYTVKNEKGEEKFSFKWGYDYITGAGMYKLPGGIGLFRSKPYEDNPGDGYAELFTWDGIKISRIEHLLSIDMISASEMTSVATPNKKIMVLGSGGTAILIANGKEVWRKSALGYLSVSPDGKYIAGGTNIDGEGTIYVYNYDGILLYSYKFPHKSRSQPRTKFSSNNKWLAATFGGKIAFFNNTSGQCISQKECEGTILSFAKNDNYILTVAKRSQKIYIYDTLGNLKETLNVPYGEEIKKKRTKEGEMIESKVLYSNWICEVFDDLVITNSGREWHPIVFKLE